MTSSAEQPKVKTKQEIAIEQVLWRLGVDTDASAFDDNSLIEIIGDYPDLRFVTRLTEANDLYPLLIRDDTILQSVRINRYNGLTFHVLIGDNAV